MSDLTMSQFSNKEEYIKALLNENEALQKQLAVAVDALDYIKHMNTRDVVIDVTKKALATIKEIK